MMGPVGQELITGVLILVDSLLPRIGRKSCTFAERMLHMDTKEVHGTYETIDVFFAPQTPRSTEMPAAIRQALTKNITKTLHIDPWTTRVL
jgi:acyl-CoA thioester hydrolase